MFTIKLCKTSPEFEKARKVTEEYIDWLGMDLTFQKVENELAGFTAMYSPPEGCYLIAFAENGETAGGVGLRKFEEGICEMKRLYVYPKYLKKGLGEALCRELIKQAKKFGYKKMRLDTIGKLKVANKLYDKLGFYEIEPYRANPDKTARFMEYIL
ncbi:MAG: GNAT family N-acetyltransferase [Ignavibacteriaceae bacterium]